MCFISRDTDALQGWRGATSRERTVPTRACSANRLPVSTRCLLRPHYASSQIPISPVALLSTTLLLGLQLLLENLLLALGSGTTLPAATAQACLPHWLQAAGWALAALSDSTGAAALRLAACPEPGPQRSCIEEQVRGGTRDVAIWLQMCCENGVSCCVCGPRDPTFVAAALPNRLRASLLLLPWRVTDYPSTNMHVHARRPHE